jgi:shikimate kinase
MLMFLITGQPGTGKSTIKAELVSRGIRAYDADEDHLAHWYSSDGTPVPHDEEESTPEFVASHTRDIARQTILDMTTETNSMFICGDPENEDELQDFFTVIFALTLDETIRQQRLDTRTNNLWGKLPHERAYDLARTHIALERYKKPNYITIDAAQRPAVIVDIILETIRDKGF